jgi:3-methyladenine DNA glycosylase AlkD
MNSKTYLKQIELQFETRGNPEIAQQMEAYMRNKFVFLEIKAPLRKKLLQPVLSKANRPSVNKVKEVVKYLWAKPQREYQLIAMEIANGYVKEME